jgi:hypothetical protein
MSRDLLRSMPPPINKYSTAGFTLSIECEKCHGPGTGTHRTGEVEASGAAASAILNPARFSRDRQMDLCASCHGGHGQPLLPSFSYVPGEPLTEYIDFPPPDPSAPLDVHGNQVELLKQSRCFRSSAMTCITCHEVHATQHNLADFSQKCLGCHKPDSATFAGADHPLTKNCIDCHMPRQEKPDRLRLEGHDGKTRDEKPLDQSLSSGQGCGEPLSRPPSQTQ